MTEIDVAVGGAGFVGGVLAALIGAAVGHRLASEREDLNLRREAAEQVIAAAMEALAYLQAVDVQLAGGPPAPDMRTDFARDALIPIARLGVMGKRSGRLAAEAIGDAQRAAIATYFTSGTKPDDRKAAQAMVMAKINEFRALAEADFKS